MTWAVPSLRNSITDRPSEVQPQAPSATRANRPEAVAGGDRIVGPPGASTRSTESNPPEDRGRIHGAQAERVTGGGPVPAPPGRPGGSGRLRLAVRPLRRLSVRSCPEDLQQPSASGGRGAGSLPFDLAAGREVRPGPRERCRLPLRRRAQQGGRRRAPRGVAATA